MLTFHILGACLPSCLECGWNALELEKPYCFRGGKQRQECQSEAGKGQWGLRSSGTRLKLLTCLRFRTDHDEKIPPEGSRRTGLVTAGRQVGSPELNAVRHSFQWCLVNAIPSETLCRDGTHCEVLGDRGVSKVSFSPDCHGSHVSPLDPGGGVPGLRDSLIEAHKIFLLSYKSGNPTWIKLGLYKRESCPWAVFSSTMDEEGP